MQKYIVAVLDPDGGCTFVKVAAPDETTAKIFGHYIECGNQLKTEDEEYVLSRYNLEAAADGDFCDWTVHATLESEVLTRTNVLKS